MPGGGAGGAGGGGGSGGGGSGGGSGGKGGGEEGEGQGGGPGTGRGKPDVFRCPNCGSTNVSITGIVAVYVDAEGKRRTRFRFKCNEPPEKCSGPDYDPGPLPEGATIVGGDR